MSRHNGFIPWDDDIDVGMPRKDYTRLKELFGHEVVCDRFMLEHPETPGGSGHYPIAKLYDTTTTLVERKRALVRRGVFLDIFPLDGMGSSEHSARLRYSYISLRYDVFLANAAGIRPGRSKVKNALVAALSSLASSPASLCLLARSLDRACAKLSFEDSAWGGNPLGAWRFREIMPVGYYGTPTLRAFENARFYGVEKPEEYLSRLYGNWRELPPENRRRSHHDFVEIDLNKSFLK